MATEDASIPNAHELQSKRVMYYSKFVNDRKQLRKGKEGQSAP